MATFYFANTYCQEKQNIQLNKYDENKVYSETNKPAEFKGGMKAFTDYFSKKFKIKDEMVASDNMIKLVFSFVVDVDGSIVDIQFIRFSGTESQMEARKVLKESPKWTPGVKDGVPVRCLFTVPINFQVGYK